MARRESGCLRGDEGVCLAAWQDGIRAMDLGRGTMYALQMG